MKGLALNHILTTANDFTWRRWVPVSTLVLLTNQTSKEQIYNKKLTCEEPALNLWENKTSTTEVRQISNQWTANQIWRTSCSAIRRKHSIKSARKRTRVQQTQDDFVASQTTGHKNKIWSEGDIHQYIRNIHQGKHRTQIDQKPNQSLGIHVNAHSKKCHTWLQWGLCINQSPEK
jgi:hypothetical protein